MKLPPVLQRLAIAADRLCAYDHCRLPLPWFAWTRHTDDAARLGRGHAVGGEQRGEAASRIRSRKTEVCWMKHIKG